MADSDKTGSELASLNFQELLSGLEAGVPAVEPSRIACSSQRQPW